MAPPVNFRNPIQRGKAAVRSDTPNDLRDNWPDHRDGNIHGRSMGLPINVMRNYHDTFYPGSARPQSPPRVRRIGEGFPSRTLLICYPTCVTIDEKRLYDAMILFGEIEGIQSFPSKKYSLVKFRSIDEARCAKDGLHGRLFNDPRIIIMFPNSDHVPNDDMLSNSRSMIPDLDAPNWRRLSLGPIPSIGTNADLQGYMWHGNIAKGGSTICSARCVAVGQGIDSNLPKVINCSARTGLETLTKHYADAIGFDMVFFLPDTERDFPSYTNFLQYLVNKNRAGVSKLDDGTTLFLVPPSDFLTKVLNIVGPERLYGVVLKFPQILESVVSQTHSSQSNNGHNAIQSNGAESFQAVLAPIKGENLQTFSQNYLTPNHTPINPIPIPEPPFYPLPMQTPQPFQGFSTAFPGQHIIPNLSYFPPVGAVSFRPEQLSYPVRPSFYGAGQVTSNFEADKNQWSQSTLQFAANILEQIHQHESSTQTGQVPRRN